MSEIENSKNEPSIEVDNLSYNDEHDTEIDEQTSTHDEELILETTQSNQTIKEEQDAEQTTVSDEISKKSSDISSALSKTATISEKRSVSSHVDSVHSVTNVPSPSSVQELSEKNDEKKSSQSLLAKVTPSLKSIFAKYQLHKMSDEELINAVKELENNVRHLKSENAVFLNFLEKIDPTAIETMESVLKVAQDRISTASKRLSKLSRRESLFQSATSIFTGYEKEGPRINYMQKMDIVYRQMDEFKALLNQLNNKCNVFRHKYTAELEEMDTRELELQETLSSFEDVVINCAVDAINKTSPIDKFARFMEERYRHNRAVIEKLRLRHSSLKVQYQKICTQLNEKKLLGANLQEVDFEQLVITNAHLVEKIEQRNVLLIEMKKMNGKANLLLSRTKKQLLKKMETLKYVQEEINYHQDLMVKMDAECEIVGEELQKAKEDYDVIKTNSETYQVPSVMDYIRQKADMDALKKNIKVWARRKQIKDMAFTALKRELNNIILAKGKGLYIPSKLDKKISSTKWTKASTFEFMFEKKSRLSHVENRVRKSNRKIY